MVSNLPYILIAYATKKICLCKDSLLHFLNIQTKLHKVIAHFYRLNYNSCSVICGFVFWKFLIKKIINQGKNIYLFFSKLEEKRKGNFLKISSRIHKYNKNLYIFNPPPHPKKKKKTPTNFLYNIFSKTTFLYLSIIFPTNKQLPHITPFFVTDNLFVAQGMQVTAGAKLHERCKASNSAWSLGKKGWMVQHLPLHLHSLHLLLLLHQGLFVHHLHRVDVTCILKSLY